MPWAEWPGSREHTFLLDVCDSPDDSCRDVAAAVLAETLIGTLLTRVGLPDLPPLPWSQTLALFVWAMVSCLVVNDAVKIALIKWRVPTAVGLTRPRAALASPTTRDARPCSPADRERHRGGESPAICISPSPSHRGKK